MKTLIDKIVWRMFYLFERIGFHVLPIHYYSPIPDTRHLRKHSELLTQEQPMSGVDLREDAQIDLLNLLKDFEDEYRQAGGGRFGVTQSEMPSYAPINALGLYTFVRHFKSKRVIEIGAGMSTKITSAAITKNKEEGHGGEFIVIEPYPSSELRKGYEGLSRLIVEKIENLDISIFKSLEADDILFIDSSHTVKPLGDVNFLFLHVIPQLNPGVIIHVHDIFFPVDYLPHHFFRPGLKMFWQEQYLLHAFLLFNHEFEVMISMSYLHFKHQSKLKELFPWYQSERWPSSFWMRRKDSR